MAINPTAVGSQSILDSTLFSVENLSTQPVAGEVFTPSRPPGQLVTFFNGGTQRFELYCVNSAGNRFYRVV